MIDAVDRPVRRDRDDFEAVDLHEFFGFGHGRSGHARQLGVEFEEVLDCDRGQGLRFFLYANAFLGLDRLMQAV